MPQRPPISRDPAVAGGRGTGTIGTRARLSAGRAVVPVVYAAVVGAASLLAAGAPVLVLAAVTTASYLFFLMLWMRRFRPALSFVDPGLLFQFVILLYSLFPLIAIWFYDYQFGRSGDDRLAQIVLDDDIISSVWLCANLAMAGFGASYLGLRSMKLPTAPVATRAVLPVLWISCAFSGLVLVVLYLLRGGSSEYLDEYLFYADLPRYLLQLLNINSGLFQAAVFGLFICYFRTRPALAVTIGAFVCLFFLATTQARGGVVVFGAGMLIAADHFRRRFSPIVLAGAAVAGLSFFLALGLLRAGEATISDAAGRNEFMALFVTALDIRQLYITGSTLDMNANLLVSDVLRLIPQQILPFEKVDPATWYVSTFYPGIAEAGGGLAFGLLAEAVLGGGGAAALIRGLTLGALVSISFNYLSARVSLWRLIIYMWLFTNLYQCFRDTTFTLIGRFVFQFGPAVLVMMLLYQFIAPRGATAPGSREPGVGRARSV